MARTWQAANSVEVCDESAGSDKASMTHAFDVMWDPACVQHVDSFPTPEGPRCPVNRDRAADDVVDRLRFEGSGINDNLLDSPYSGVV